jgi:hypothetical protein
MMCTTSCGIVASRNRESCIDPIEAVEATWGGVYTTELSVVGVGDNDSGVPP